MEIRDYYHECIDINGEIVEGNISDSSIVGVIVNDELAIGTRPIILSDDICESIIRDLKVIESMSISAAHKLYTMYYTIKGNTDGLLLKDYQYLPQKVSLPSESDITSNIDYLRRMYKSEYEMIVTGSVFYRADNTYLRSCIVVTNSFQEHSITDFCSNKLYSKVIIPFIKLK